MGIKLLTIFNLVLDGFPRFIFFPFVISNDRFHFFCDSCIYCRNLCWVYYCVITRSVKGYLYSFTHITIPCSIWFSSGYKAFSNLSIIPFSAIPIRSSVLTNLSPNALKSRSSIAHQDSILFCFIQS